LISPECGSPPPGRAEPQLEPLRDLTRLLPGRRGVLSREQPPPLGDDGREQASAGVSA
jgi:hypothetical protein